MVRKYRLKVMKTPVGVSALFSTFLHYFQPAFSGHLSERPRNAFNFMWLLKTGLAVHCNDVYEMLMEFKCHSLSVLFQVIYGASYPGQV